jgi:hypothetical protein
MNELVGQIQSSINLTREAIKQGPEYTKEALITRDYEIKLHSHYGCDGIGKMSLLAR